MKGAVILDIAKGRRVLGYEVGFVAASGTAPANLTLAVVLNNDVDFVVTRMMLVQFGLAGCEVVLPKSVTANIRDSATGNVMFRQSGSFSSFGNVPAWPVPSANGAGMDGRYVRNSEGLPAPYLMRRGSSAFVEINNPAAYTFTGDLYVMFEGFYVYPSADGKDNDPVPAQIKGYCLPFSWNGTLVVGASAVSVIANLGTIQMLGPGVGHFILKTASVSAFKLPSAVNSGQPGAGDVLGINIYDTRESSKRWQHVTAPPPSGSYMPASFLTVGGISAPWAHPRYMGGTDKVFVEVFGDTTAWPANTPGTVEVQLNGVWIPS
jgi:hypothetical protein